MLVKAVLPPTLVGFFAAVMVGAVLSTFNSVLNSSATLFSEGIYKILINPAATERQMVVSGRLCSIVLAVAAMFTAPLIDTTGSLYNYLQRINATFFGPMLAVILLGFMTRRISALAAKVGLIVGPMLFYLLVFSLGDQVQALLKATFGLSDEVHFLHFLALVFVITVGLLVLISYFKPSDHYFDQGDVGAVDMRPWKYVRIAGAAISIVTITVYVLLAQ